MVSHGVFWCVAVHCSPLQSIAVCCSLLQWFVITSLCRCPWQMPWKIKSWWGSIRLTIALSWPPIPRYTHTHMMNNTSLQKGATQYEYPLLNDTPLNTDAPHDCAVVVPDPEVYRHTKDDLCNLTSASHCLWISIWMTLPWIKHRSPDTHACDEWCALQLREPLNMDNHYEWYSLKSAVVAPDPNEYEYRSCAMKCAIITCCRQHKCSWCSIRRFHFQQAFSDPMG